LIIPEINIKDSNNNIVEKITLRDDVFGVRAKEGVIHEAVVNFLANQRQGTHATKTKGLVRGGGKKPWRQKHTGRARSGSVRSPLWRGGGIVFGPLPRDYSYNIPKKVKRLALMAAFQEKLSAGEVVVVNNFNIEKPRTKDMISILKNLGLNDNSVLIVLPGTNNTVELSARNIPGVGIVNVSDLTTYDVVAFNTLLMTKEAVTRLEEIKGS
jgi:large subunit ribosomal protein L4